MTAVEGHTPLQERLLSLAAGLAASVHHAAADDQLTAHAARLIDELNAVLREKQSGDDPAAVRPLTALGSALIEDYQERARASLLNGGVVGLRTGLDHLDETINGLEAGKLYVLAAQPGAGKTSLCLQIAATVAQSGVPALYVSLENDDLDLLRKTACRLSDVSYSAALKGKLSPQRWEEAVALVDEKIGNRLYVSTPRALMPKLDDLVRQVVTQAGRSPGVVVIDYLQQMAMLSSSETMEERQVIDRFTPMLRHLAEQYHCAVVAISSQNRASYGAGGMASYKGSGGIEYNADVTIDLIHEEVTKGAPLSAMKRVKLTVTKNRQGLSGRPIALDLYGDRCMIAEVEV